MTTPVAPQRRTCPLCHRSEGHRPQCPRGGRVDKDVRRLCADCFGDIFVDEPLDALCVDCRRTRRQIAEAHAQRLGVEEETVHRLARGARPREHGYRRD